ncbi:MAG: hypothetical protein ACSHYB_14460 [Roseibacillus sp.]
MLVELSLAVSLLLFISLWSFRTNLQTIRPRNWAMVQTITDAYMTGPLAQAESVDFNELLDDTVTDWPTYPNKKTTTDVLVGTLPVGTDESTGTLVLRKIKGTLVQTKQPAANNLPANPTAAQIAANPARVESWLVQSHLTYSVGSRTYIKSRSTVRTR